MYKITIDPVLNGFVVYVGCQRVVFVSVGVMLDEIKKYLLDPQAMEKHYRENSLNSRILLHGTCVENETQAVPPEPIYETSRGGLPGPREF